jgi:hypothetical protein
MIAAPAAPFVHLDVTALQDFASEMPVDRLEPKGDELHPACQSRARQGDPVPGAQDRFLPVERKVVAVFGHRDAGQKPGGGDAAFLRQRGQRRDDWRGVLVHARDIFWPNEDAADVAGRFAIEQLGALLADAAPLAGIGGDLLGLEDLFHNGKVRGNPFAAFTLGPGLQGDGLLFKKAGPVFSRRLRFLLQRQHQLQLPGMEFFTRGPKHPAQNEIHLLPQELVFLPQALVLRFQMLEHFQQALDLLEGDVFAGLFHSKKYTACCLPA